MIDRDALAHDAAALVRVPSVTGDERAVLERLGELAAGHGLRGRAARPRPRSAARAPRAPGRGGAANGAAAA